MYAMKEFKATKSAAKVAKEADFQAQAAAVDAAPAVVAVPGGKPPSIVMECMDRTAVEVCRAQGGSLTDAQQWKILALYEALDGIRVLHNDANPLNLMCRRAPGAAAAATASADEEHEQWRLIDYGFAKKQTSKHRENPNLNMSLKLLLRSTMGLMTRGALTAPPAILLAALEQESHRPTGVGAPPPTAAIAVAGGSSSSSSSSSEAEEEAEDEQKEVQPRRRRAAAKKPAAAGTKRGAPQRRSGRSMAAGTGTGASAAAAAAAAGDAPTPKRTSKRLRAAGVLGEVSANVMAQQGGEGGGAAALASGADDDSDTEGRPYTARGVVRGVVTAAAAIGFAAMGGLF